jgi:hypothetical protein
MRRRSMFLLPLLLGLGACANIVAGPAPSPSPPPPPVAAVSTSPQATPSAALGTPLPALTDARGAVAIVRARVTGVSPRLLPTAIPAGMEVTVGWAGPGGYSLQYTDDLHTHTIVVITDMPMGMNGPHQSMRTLRFRGRDATYQVFDTTVPTSRRILYWMEPGTQVNGPTVGQVPYYFSASGFTEAEFFQLADSLLPV